MAKVTFDHEAAGAMLAGGMTPQEVADRWGVSRSAIYLLRARRPELCTPQPEPARPRRDLDVTGRAYPSGAIDPITGRGPAEREPGSELLAAVLAFVVALDRRVLAALGEEPSTR